MKPNIQKLADYINQQEDPEWFMEVLLALAGPKKEAEKMARGGTGANQYTAEQSGQNVRSASRREIKDGTAGRIGKQYGVNGRTIRRDADFV